MTVLTGISICAVVACYLIIALRVVAPSIAVFAAAGVLMLVHGIAGFPVHVNPSFTDFLLFYASSSLLSILLQKSGFHEYVALKVVKATKGRSLHLLVALSLLSAISACLTGSVFSLLVLGPIGILVAVELDISALPFLLMQTLASSLGGLASSMGDPVSMIVSSVGNFSFLTILYNNGVFALLAVAILVAVAAIFYRKRLHVARERRARVLEFDESRSIADPKRLVASLAALGTALVGLCAAPLLHLTPSVPLLFACGVLFLYLEKDAEQILKDFDWSNLVYLFGLTIMVAALMNTQCPAWIVNALERIYAVSPLLLSLTVFFVPAVLTLGMNTVPLVLFGSEILVRFGAMHPGSDIQMLWWGLSIGAVIGGNASVKGSRCSSIFVQLARNNNVKLDAAAYTRTSLPLVILSLAIGFGYLWLRYSL